MVSLSSFLPFFSLASPFLFVFLLKFKQLFFVSYFLLLFIFIFIVCVCVCVCVFVCSCFILPEERPKISIMLLANPHSASAAGRTGKHV